MDAMKKISAFLLIIFIVLLLGWSIITVPTHDRQEIKSWATNKGYVVTTIDQHTFDTGPFWHMKGCRIYKVKTENMKVVWFRFQLFGTDIIEEDVDADGKKIASKNKD